MLEPLAVLVQRHQVFRSVGKRRVPYVVKERGEANQLLVAGEPMFVIAVNLGENVTGVVDDGTEEQRGGVQDAEGVLKTSMRGSRIYLVGPCQLLDAAKPLKWTLCDDLPLPLTERDEPVNRASKLVWTG